MEKIKCPTLSNSKKIAKGIIGEKLKFMGETFINVFFTGKERKLKVFVMRNTQNLFGTDWMGEFDLFNVPINTFCNKIDGTSTSSDKLKKEVKIKFQKIFSEGLGFCSKVKAKNRNKRKCNASFSTEKTSTRGVG